MRYFVYLTEGGGFDKMKATRWYEIIMDILGFVVLFALAFLFLFIISLIF